MNIRKQMRKIYFFEGLVCLQLTGVIWVLVLLQRGFSLVQVGIAEGVFHVTSMICEVPSGMAADVFGRKRTLALSGLAGMISCLLIGFGEWEGWIYLGMMFSALNYNLISGTEEALMYDSLVTVGEQDSYKKRRFYMTLIGNLCNAAGSLAGPWLLVFGYQKVYGFCAVLQLCCVGLSWTMAEPLVTEGQKQRQERPFEGMTDRIREHVCHTFQFMKEHPGTMCKLFADAAIACPGFLTLMYLQKHLVNCGLPEKWIGVPLLFIPLAGTAGSWLASKCNAGLKKVIAVCGILCGIGTCMAGSSVIWAAIAGAVIGRICLGFTELCVSERVNEEFSSDQRATLISVDAMLYSVLMVIASPVTGYLGNRYGMKILFLVLGGILATMTIVGMIWYIQKEKLKFRNS